MSNRTVCLMMIVKNENKIVGKCLEAVKPLIDAWVIVDTGSTDGTQALVRETMKDLPGDLFERPWTDFGFNRNELFSLAQGKGDYFLLLDADEIVNATGPLPFLEKDCYFARRTESNSVLPLLIKGSLSWCWEEKLGERLSCRKGEVSKEVLSHVTVFHAKNGSRSSDPDRSLKDAAILKEMLQENERPGVVFGYAMSLEEGGHLEEALKQFEKRAAMGGANQEIFLSLFKAARLREQLGHGSEEIVDAYLKSYQFRPARLEPLYYLADYFMRKKIFLMGYLISRYALSIQHPPELFYTELWIYQYGLRYQFAKCAYQCKKPEETREAFQQLLLVPTLPEDIRVNIEQNLQLAVFS